MIQTISGKFAKGLLGAAIVTTALASSMSATAQPKEVEIGLIAPMTGPWAKQGEVMKIAADLAIAQINQQGGIKSLGGAKLKLAVFDAGDSVEKS